MAQDNPWKTLGTRVVYKNPWITVREDEVIRPDGEPGIYGVVETRRAVGVLALTKDDEIYLVGQYRYPLECYSWEIIEGGSDGDETAEQTAHRELREEAGLCAQSLESLGSEVHLSNCHSAERACFFIARDLSTVEAEPEGTEVLEVRRVPLTQALAMVIQGEITDAMSCIALFRVGLNRGLLSMSV